MRKGIRGLWVFLLLILLSGCSSSDSPRDGQGDGAVVEYAIPAGWIWENPSSGLRRGQYRLPRAEGDGEDAELAVFFFEGQGGSVQSNIDRWIGQFSQEDGSPVSDVSIEDREIKGSKVTIVDVSGTYSGSSGPMMSGGSPKPNHRMLGAIVETPEGPWFFKLTGPARTVEKWQASFDEFVNSITVT